jgi:hypothetical protein
MPEAITQRLVRRVMHSPAPRSMMTQNGLLPKAPQGHRVPLAHVVTESAILVGRFPQMLSLTAPQIIAGSGHHSRYRAEAGLSTRSGELPLSLPKTPCALPCKDLRHLRSPAPCVIEFALDSEHGGYLPGRAEVADPELAERLGFLGEVGVEVRVVGRLSGWCGCVRAPRRTGRHAGVAAQQLRRKPRVFRRAGSKSPYDLVDVTRSVLSWAATIRLVCLPYALCSVGG